MTCYLKQCLDTVNVASQTLVANGAIAFATNKILVGSAITHTAGSAEIDINAKGVYEVTFDADVLPTAAGDITVQLTNNGDDVNGAEATFTGATDTTNHISFSTLIKVLGSCVCIDNSAALQVDVSAGATVSNAELIVKRIA